MDESLDLRKYFALLRRWWWLVVGCCLLAALSAYLVSTRMTPVYRATVELLVHQTPTEGMNDYNAVLMSEKLARTYTEMLTSRAVLGAVEEELELEELTDEDVSAELVRNTQMIELSVEHTSRYRAAEIANAVGAAFIARNKELQQERYADSMDSVQQEMTNLSRLIEETEAQIEALGAAETEDDRQALARLQTILAGYRNSYASLLQDYEQTRLEAARLGSGVIIFEAAQLPEEPVRPRPLVNTGLAGVVGGMLAVGVIFLVEYLDDTIKTPEDVTQTLGLSTLGTIGEMRPNGAGALVTVSDPLSPISEAFRVLRTNIRYSAVDKPLRTLLVTSASPTEGKSNTVANLAVAMSHAGLKVAVIDADLRRPRLHEVFGLHPKGGLTGALLEGEMDGRLQPSRVEGLSVLPAGDIPPNPAELLGSHRLQDLLDTLSQMVDVALIDSPPVLPVTDAAVLAREVDGVLLVVNAGDTRREQAQRAVEGLRQVGANVIGVVLNQVATDHRDYYHKYYGDRKKERRIKWPWRHQSKNKASSQEGSAMAVKR